MKKFIFSLAIMASVAMTPNAASAQKPVYIEAELIYASIDSIELIKGAYEYFVRIKNNKSVDCSLEPHKCRAFMISVNEKLYTDIIKLKKAGVIVKLEGPQFDGVIKDRLLKDYRAVRDNEEREKQNEIDAKMKTPDKEKKKEKKARLAQVTELKAELKKLKLENAALVLKLEKILNERMAINAKLGCYYIYNFETVKDIARQ